MRRLRRPRSSTILKAMSAAAGRTTGSSRRSRKPPALCRRKQRSRGMPNLDRRGFLQSLGGGLLFLCAFDGEAQESGGSRGGGNKLPENIGAWLHIAPDGAI